MELIKLEEVKGNGEEKKGFLARPPKGNNGIFISTGNDKIGDILNFSLPPVLTCNCALPCAAQGDCYALQSYTQYPTVKLRWSENLAAFRTDPQGFFDTMAKMIYTSSRNMKNKKFRWFVSGDIPNKRFFKGMAEIAERIPDVDFMAFTKRPENVSSHPENLVVLYSTWPGSPIPESAESMPKTWINVEALKKKTPGDLKAEVIKGKDYEKGDDEKREKIINRETRKMNRAKKKWNEKPEFAPGTPDGSVPKGTVKCKGHCDTCYMCWDKPRKDPLWNVYFVPHGTPMKRSFKDMNEAHKAIANGDFQRQYYQKYVDDPREPTPPQAELKKMAEPGESKNSAIKRRRSIFKPNIPTGMLSIPREVKTPEGGFPWDKQVKESGYKRVF